MRLVKRKKGMTLIEVIVSMFISSVIIVISTTIFINLYRYKVKSDKEYSSRVTVNNISLFIESQVYKNELVYIDIVTIDEGYEALRYVYQDKLNETKYRVKDVYHKNDRVIIKTHTYGDGQNKENTNVLSSNIKQFECIKKENLIYVKIQDEFMQEEDICIVTRGMYY